MPPLEATPPRAPIDGVALRMEWPVPEVALVTFRRADELNVITLAMMEELDRALTLARRDRAAALVLTGSGRAFCAGADLKLITSPETGFYDSPTAFRDIFLAPLARLFDSMEETPFPIVAAINGHALGGGCEMALSADLRIMARPATLGLPEVRLGATPGAGGVQKLIRHVGRSKALEWILLGDRISAEEAERRGLVTEITGPDELLPRALALASRFAALGPQAVAQAKASIYLAEDADLRSARRYGVEALTALASTPEWREGVAAFVEKRPPRFR